MSVIYHHPEPPYDGAAEAEMTEAARIIFHGHPMLRSISYKIERLDGDVTTYSIARPPLDAASKGE